MVHRQRWETDGINSKCMDRRLDEKDYTEITDGKFIFYIFFGRLFTVKMFHSPSSPSTSSSLSSSASCNHVIKREICEKRNISIPPLEISSLSFGLYYYDSVKTSL